MKEAKWITRLNAICDDLWFIPTVVWGAIILGTALALLMVFTDWFGTWLGDYWTFVASYYPYT